MKSCRDRVRVGSRWADKPTVGFGKVRSSRRGPTSQTPPFSPMANFSASLLGANHHSGSKAELTLGRLHHSSRSCLAAGPVATASSRRGKNSHSPYLSVRPIMIRCSASRPKIDTEVLQRTSALPPVPCVKTAQADVQPGHTYVLLHSPARSWITVYTPGHACQPLRGRSSFRANSHAPSLPFRSAATNGTC